MSKKDIQIFSLDTITQEERDFLAYMYGGDLEKMPTKRLNRLHWWVQAFQAVKAGKRPKFNWAAFFSCSLWALRKKQFPIAIFMAIIPSLYHLVAYAFEEYTFLSSPGAFVVSISTMLWFGGFSSKVLISSYMSSKKDIKVGSLPFYLVFLHSIIISIYIYYPAIIHGMGAILYRTYSNVIYDTLFRHLTFILYAFLLMKFWLPEKKEKNAK